MTKICAKRKLLHDINNFKEAYMNLLNSVTEYEVTTGESVNDLKWFVDRYPFDCALEDLPILSWVNGRDTKIDLRNFKVLNYEYLNTGGNCMVGVFTVWLTDEKRTVYALTNEEGCNLAVVDYISNELDIDDYDELIIDNCVFSFLTGTEKYFDLYRYCLAEYTKSDCRYFGNVVPIKYMLLSDELQEKVHPDYYVWLEEQGYDEVMTDGVNILTHPDYDAMFTDPHEDDEDLQAVKEWKSWHDGLINNTTTDEEMDSFYEKKYRLTFNGKRVYLPFNADTFNKINDLLDSVIREW